MPPAPKVMAIYFPQYHAFEENDRFWGRGFTEWTLLKPFEGKGIRKPLSVEQGGLGFYDLTSRDVRKQQAQLAMDHGVHGFLFYHYWFTGKGVKKPMVMEKIPSLMLEDGEPNMRYFFNWANEPWTRMWNGRASAENPPLLAQEYGDQSEWQNHFEFLLPYFKHEQYMKMNGKPIFAIYRPGLIAAEAKLGPMLSLWRQLAQQHGFPGMYFVNTHSGFWQEMVGQPQLFDAAYHFLSTCCSSGREYNIATAADQGLNHEPVQFWGAFTGFNNRVRGTVQLMEKPVTPHQFYAALVHSFSAMASAPQRRLDQFSNNIFVVAAWNEWNEQNVLEPDTEYGFGFLKSLQKALTHFHSSRFVSTGDL
ncbi:unnamed protein product [Prorocentrum cordatum]|uniref:Glycosyl transferase family WbsX n=1 Tax=Prorocentrum cordatum TaxID=2364126 RepID=A0ABN9Q7H4_9DINO|nr:unnamed protein product [Polarella glacialis]